VSEQTGKLVVISGPSGAGKTSVCKALKDRPNVEFSVSATTRAIRKGEVEGVDYHYLSRDEFERRIRAGEFLEWASYNGNLYGTLRAPMERALAAGRIFLLEIEVQGTRQLRTADVPGMYVFIVPPDMNVLEQRLRKRGNNSEHEIEQRLRIAAAEMEAKGLYDHIVVNEDLQETVRTVAELIDL
jgi:guanylate kinase